MGRQQIFRFMKLVLEDVGFLNGEEKRRGV